MWASGGAYHPWQGFNAITIMIPGLLANDVERQGAERTLWGVVIATLTVLAAMNLLTAALAVAQPGVTGMTWNRP